MSVIVSRGAGDKPGDDIISEVLCTQVLQILRGTAEINARDSDRIKLSGTLPGVSYMAPTSIINTTDREGDANGYLTDFAFTISTTSGYSATSSVIIEQVDK